MSGADRSYQLVPASSTPVTFEGHEVTVLEHDGEYWFIAREICDVLEIQQPHRAVSGLDDDEKGRHTVTTPGGPQQVTLISESGMYTLILRSRKPQARPFRRWVTHELLPTIRKTGRYEAPGLAAPQPSLSPTDLMEDAIARALDAGVTTRCLARLARARAMVALGKRPAMPRLEFEAPVLPAPAGVPRLPAPQRVATALDLQPFLGGLLRYDDGREVYGWIQGQPNPAWFPAKREYLRALGYTVPDEVYARATVH